MWHPLTKTVHLVNFTVVPIVLRACPHPSPWWCGRSKLTSTSLIYWSLRSVI